MSIEDLAQSPDFASFVSGAEVILGGELYVLAHDMSQLRPLSGNPDDAITDVNVVDAMLGGTTYSTDGTTFVPVMSRSFPLLAVARTGAEDVSEPVSPSLVGLIADFHRAFFDPIELRRRPSPFEAAAQLQWSMLPVRAAQSSQYEVAGVLQPASSVAGDAYDFAMNPAGNLTTLVMDAMGHGVTATLSTSLALATVRAKRRAGAGLVEQVCAADQAILDEYGGARFVTMVAVEFQPDSIVVVNAGHEPIRLLGADGSVRSLNLLADAPLGLDGPTDYREQALPPLQSGEALALLSDGASEAADIGGKRFGPDGVNEALSRLRTTSALQTADRIGRAIMEYVGADLSDDLTVVVAQRLDH